MTTDDRLAGRSASTWVGVAFAAAAVLATIVVVARFWTSSGDAEISTAGWLAMGLGIVVTLALGVGLMALVFISSRRGYDEPGREDR